MPPSPSPPDPFDELVAEIGRRLLADRSTIVGIAGSVAVGKTTLAAAVAQRLVGLGHTVATVSTDPDVQ